MRILKLKTEEEEIHINLDNINYIRKEENNKVKFYFVNGDFLTFILTDEEYKQIGIY